MRFVKFLFTLCVMVCASVGLIRAEDISTFDPPALYLQWQRGSKD